MIALVGYWPCCPNRVLWSAASLPITGAGPLVWAYHDLLPTTIHQVGKDQTQSIERKHRTSDPAGFADPHQAVSTLNNLLLQVGFDARYGDWLAN